MPNNFAPVQETALPLLKTRRISALPFNRSSRLKRKLKPNVSIGLFLVGHSQLYPALCPAALEDHSSSPGTHPGPETEFTVALYLTRLVSSFHRISSLAVVGTSM
jgi:hypothetical protein